MKAKEFLISIFCTVLFSVMLCASYKFVFELQGHDLINACIATIGLSFFFYFIYLIVRESE